LSGDGLRLVIGADENDAGNLGHVEVYDWTGSAWSQLGTDISNAQGAAGDRFGVTVAISSDGSFVAVGSVGRNTNRGQVYIYRWSGSAWVLEQSFTGSSFSNELGWSLALSSDGMRIAMGSPFHGVSSSNKGMVQVFELNQTNGDWYQVGNGIFGNDQDTLGYQNNLSLSDDGTRLVVAAQKNDGNGGTGADCGQVRVFDWNESASDWVLLDNAIYGLVAGDEFGDSVAVSADGSRLVVGASLALSGVGEVRVFDLPPADDLSGFFRKMGAAVSGEAAGDAFGAASAISADGARVAIGAPGNDGGGAEAGSVRVYDWDGFAWSQAGADIDGAAGDGLGNALAMSDDGSRIVIGGDLSDSGGADSGVVKVYDWSGSAWSQTGSSLVGAAGDYFGTSVDMSADGSRIIVGADQVPPLGGTGYAEAYEWSGSAWVQLGATISGPSSNDRMGASVAISGDGLRIAMSMPGDDTGFSNAGLVRVYEWSPAGWVQLPSIAGIEGDEEIGESLSMSFDGSRVAIGFLDPGETDALQGINAGKARIYEWNGSSWVQMGSTILGSSQDRIGLLNQISLSADGARVVIGANEGDQGSGGYVQVWDWDGTDWVLFGASIYGSGEGGRVNGSVALTPDGRRLVVGAVPGSSFSPIDLSPTVWFDAADSSTIIGSNNVSEWGDKSGNGYNLTQPVGSFWPRIDLNTINSRPVMNFLSSDHMHTSTATNISQPFHVFAVAEKTQTFDVSYMMDEHIGASGNFVAFSLNGSTSYDLNAGTVLSGGAPDRDPHVMHLFVNGSNSEINIDTVNVATGNAGTNSLDLLTLGKEVNNFGNGAFNGDIAEFIIVEGSLTSQQIADAEEYLAIKWGLSNQSSATGYYQVYDLEPRDVFEFDFLAMRNTTDTTAIPDNLGTPVAALYDTLASYSGTDISYDAGTFTVNSAGKYLVGYSEHVATSDTTADRRVSHHTWIRVNGVDAPYYGWDAGYIRAGSNGSLAAITSGVAILDLAANDTFQIVIQRSDVSTKTVNRVADRSGAYVVSFDPTFDYARYSGLGAVSGIGDGSLVPFVLDTTDELSSESVFARSGNNVVINSSNPVLYAYSARAAGEASLVDASQQLQSRIRLSGLAEEQGSLLLGAAGGDDFGDSVALSSDGSRLAAGASGSATGYVDVYDWSGSAWSLLGSSINGSSGSEAGVAVDLSSNGSRVIVGAPGASSGSGQVEVFDWSGSVWTQVGSTLTGAASDGFGNSVAISSDGSRIAVGANSANGYVKLYDWSGSAWVQTGSTLSGGTAGDNYGGGLALSGDGSCVAVGADGYDGTAGTDSGYTQVYEWTGSAWSQMGTDLEGDAAGDQFGYSVVLSSDGERLAVGAPGRGPAGYVKVFDWNGSAWVQAGVTSYGTGKPQGNRVSVRTGIVDEGNVVSVQTPEHKPGDLIMLFFTSNDNINNTQPDGETGWSNTQYNDAGTVASRLYYKLAGASEPSSYSFTTSNDHHSLIAVAVADAASASITTDYDALSSQSVGSVELTGLTSGDYLGVIFTAMDEGVEFDGSISTEVDGWTVQAIIEGPSFGSSDNSSFVATKEYYSVTAVNSPTVSFGNARNADTQQRLIVAVPLNTLTAESDSYGSSLAMSSNGSRIAVGTASTGSAAVLDWDGSSWIQVGDKVVEVSELALADDRHSSALSGDGGVLARGSVVAGTMPTVRSVSSAQGDSSDLWVTVTAPAGLQQGDLILLHVNSDINFVNTNPDGETGWSNTGVVFAGTSLYSNLFYKLAGASEPSSYTFTFGTSDYYGVVAVAVADPGSASISTNSTTANSQTVDSSQLFGLTTGNYLGLIFNAMDEGLQFDGYISTAVDGWTVQEILDGAQASVIYNSAFVASKPYKYVSEINSPAVSFGNARDIDNQTRLTVAVPALSPEGAVQAYGLPTSTPTAIAGSHDEAYLRNSPSADVSALTYGGMSASGLLYPTSGDLYFFDLVTKAGGDTFTSFDYTLQLVELPAIAKTILVEATDGELNAAATDFTFDTNPHIDTDVFTHTAGTSVVEVDAPGTYLVMGALAATSFSSTQHAVPALSFRVNNVEDDSFGTSSYNRGTDAGFAAMATSGLLTVAAGDDIELYLDRLGTATGSITNDSGAMSLVQLSAFETKRVMYYNGLIFEEMPSVHYWTGSAWRQLPAGKLKYWAGGGWVPLN
jgi:hypothetical protein